MFCFFWNQHAEHQFATGKLCHGDLSKLTELQRKVSKKWKDVVWEHHHALKKALVAVVQRAAAGRSNSSLISGLLLFSCRQCITLQSSVLIHGFSSRGPSGRGGGWGAKGGSDATPSDRSNGQPAVVPLFPWQRCWGAAELQSEAVIYWMGGRGQKGGAGGRWVEGEYYRKRMLEMKNKDGGVGGWLLLIQREHEEAERTCLLALSAGSSGCSGDAPQTNGHSRIKRLVMPPEGFSYSVWLKYTHSPGLHIYSHNVRRSFVPSKGCLKVVTEIIRGKVRNVASPYLKLLTFICLYVHTKYVWTKMTPMSSSYSESSDFD